MKRCDLSPGSDLVWDFAADPEGEYILDFGWKKINPQDDSALQRDLFAIETFSKAFPDARVVVMAAFDGDCKSQMHWTDQLVQELKESKSPVQVFCAQLLSDYLHRLASFLTDEAIPTLRVIPKEGTDRALLTLMFAKRRFEHFRILCEGEPLPIDGVAPVIISLSQDCDVDLALLNNLLERYSSAKCIPEELLNEHWDEVTDIVYDPHTIGEAGKRMLLGFEAAGGATKKAR